MDHIDRQRELLKVSGFVIPGNVYKMHYSVMGFGHPGSPYHFSINITEQLPNIMAVFVIPISRKRYSKFTIPINLKNDSTVLPLEDEILDQSSFVLFRILKQIEVNALFDKQTTHLRGRLKEGNAEEKTTGKLEELVNARKKFIKSQFSVSGGI